MSYSVSGATSALSKRPLTAWAPEGEAVSFKRLKSSRKGSSSPIAYAISKAPVPSTSTEQSNGSLGTFPSATYHALAMSYMQPEEPGSRVTCCISSIIARWEASLANGSLLLDQRASAELPLLEDPDSAAVDENLPVSGPTYSPGETRLWDRTLYEQQGWVLDPPAAVTVMSSGTMYPVKSHRADLEIILVLHFGDVIDPATILRLVRVEYDSRRARSLISQDTWEKVQPDKLDLVKLKDCVRMMLEYLAYERRFPNLGHKDDGTAGLLSASFLMEIKVSEDVVAQVEAIGLLCPVVDRPTDSRPG